MNGRSALCVMPLYDSIIQVQSTAPAMIIAYSAMTSAVKLMSLPKSQLQTNRSGCKRQGYNDTSERECRGEAQRIISGQASQQESRRRV